MIPIYHLSSLNPINRVHSPQNNENSVQFCGDFVVEKRKRTKPVRRQMKIERGYLSSPLPNLSAFQNFAKTRHSHQIDRVFVFLLVDLVVKSQVKPCSERGGERGEGVARRRFSLVESPSISG